MTSHLASNPLRRIRLDELAPCPLNPRRHSTAQLTEAELQPMADSLRLGQQQPVTVRPMPGALPGVAAYELADGERRWRAARLAGLTELEAIVRVMSDEEVLDMMLATGTRGAGVEPLSPLALAHGYQERMVLGGWTLAQLAEHFNHSATVAHRILALLALPAEAAEWLDAGRLPERTAYLIARVPGDKTREAVAAEVLHPELEEGPLSYRAAALLISAKYCRSLAGAPFDPKDAALVPAAGACGACPWRAGNNPEVYGDVANKHTCMQPECFAAKATDARAAVVAKLEREGVLVLGESENALAFPAGAAGLSFKSEFVEYRKPVPADLLKPEVETAPKWVDISNGPKARVQVYAGFNQAGLPVELVKVTEAVLAADENERAIFNYETLQLHRAEHGIELENERRRAGPRRPAVPSVERGAESDEPATETAAMADPVDAQRVEALQLDLDAANKLLGNCWAELAPRMSAPLVMAVEAHLRRFGLHISPAEPLEITKQDELNRRLIEAIAESAGVAGQLDRIARAFTRKPWAECTSLSDLKKVHRALQAKSEPKVKARAEEDAA